MLQKEREKNYISFFYSFLATLTWNVCTTWWIWNSTDVGAVAAIIANALLMTLPWWGYHIFKKRYGSKIGLTSLIVFWMTFEYIHLNWQLSWPWLTLGNAFATHPDWVQWYEYTGTSGGTLWILAANIFLFELINKIRSKKYEIQLIIITAIIIIFPLIISYAIKPNEKVFQQKTPQPMLLSFSQTLIHTMKNLMLQQFHLN